MVFFDWDSVALSPQALGTIRQAAGLYGDRRGATRERVPIRQP